MRTAQAENRSRVYPTQAPRPQIIDPRAGGGVRANNEAFREDSYFAGPSMVVSTERLMLPPDLTSSKSAEHECSFCGKDLRVGKTVMHSQCRKLFHEECLRLQLMWNGNKCPNCNIDVDPTNWR